MSCARYWTALLSAGVIVALGLFARSAASEPIVVFSTGFEFEEGYDPDLTLVGQQGWVGFGSGGNGIVTNFFEGHGQQAFIGFFQAANGDDVLNVWRPINFQPVETSHSIVTFSVMMQIVDSTNERYDDFRWSVYNSLGDRLFTLDFDNDAMAISYALDDGQGFVPIGLGFDHEGFYDLVVTMNFVRNLWTATLNGVVIVNSLPVTTAAASLDLGDVDAVWAVRHPGEPGDNFMLFDNYRIVAEQLSSIPATVESFGLSPSGTFVMRIHGEEGLHYAVEASSDLVWWEEVAVFQAPAGGTLDLEDPETAEMPYQFFRVRQRPE